MFKAIFCFLVSLIPWGANGQWNNFAFFSVPTGTPFTYYRAGADFIELGTGFHAYYAYLSPSSGTTFTENITTDSAQSWSMLNNYISSWASFAGYYSVPKQKTLYRIRTNYSFNLSLVDKISAPSLNNESVHTGSSAVGIIRNLHTVDTSWCYFLSGTGLSKYYNGNVNVNFYTFSNFEGINLFFPDSLYGYIIGDSISWYYSHSVLKTTDGGNTWTNVFNDSSVYINKIYFIDAQIGYLGGNDGKIYKTDNGGSSWQPVFANNNDHVSAMYFVNSSFGFFGTTFGKICRTTDGGVTWTQDTILNDGINKLYFLNDSTAIAITEMNAYVMHQNTPVWISELQQENHGILFPNPSTGNFFIRVPEEYSGTVLKISIYSEIGQLVEYKEIIVDNGLVDCQVAPLRTGNYIVKGEAGKFRFSEKILLK